MFRKKCENRFCLVLVVIVHASLAAKAGPTIVANGMSAHEILVARRAFPITVRAAADLQHYIAKSTGVTLPIRRGDRAAGLSSWWAIIRWRARRACLPTPFAPRDSESKRTVTASTS